MFLLNTQHMLRKTITNSRLSFESLSYTTDRAT